MPIYFQTLRTILAVSILPILAIPSVSSAERVYWAENKLSRKEKSLDQLSSRLKQQERDLTELWVEVELDYNAGFFRGGLILPLDDRSHHSLYQHGISA
jgi:hypothetical protein